MREANNWALNPNGGNFIEGVDFKKIPESPTQCEIFDAKKNKWVKCTWHHHEDGQTMIPVPTDIHARPNAPHIGGRQIINEGIQGFFYFTNI